VHPKVLDFGIAKVHEGEDVAPTRSGYIMGTPEYMAIEQWGGSKHATALSDQWALGAILFECLCGRRPFEGEGVMALAMRISSGPPSSLRGFAPALSPALEAVVMRTMERSPQDRFASTRAFAAALLPFASPSSRALWAAEFQAPGTHPPVPETVAMYGAPFAPTGPAPSPVPSGARVPDTFAQSAGMRDAPLPTMSTSKRSAWIAGALALVLVTGLVGLRPLWSASTTSGTEPDAATTPITPPSITAVPAPTPPPAAPDAEPPSAPAPQAPTVRPEGPDAASAAPVQPVESDEARIARERRERDAAARSAAARARAPVDGLSPMQRAQACRTSTNTESERNNCVINALQGHANSMQELGMLGAVQMAAGRGPDASRTMRTYIQRYPDGPMVPTFQRYIDSHR
jgi:Protein kinase domain